MVILHSRHRGQAIGASAGRVRGLIAPDDPGSETRESGAVVRVPCEGAPVSEGTVVTSVAFWSKLDSAFQLALLVEGGQSTRGCSLGIGRASSAQ